MPAAQVEQIIGYSQTHEIIASLKSVTGGQAVILIAGADARSARPGSSLKRYFWVILLFYQVLTLQAVLVKRLVIIDKRMVGGVGRKQVCVWLIDQRLFSSCIRNDGLVRNAANRR